MEEREANTHSAVLRMVDKGNCVFLSLIKGSCHYIFGHMFKTSLKTSQRGGSFQAVEDTWSYFYCNPYNMTECYFYFLRHFCEYMCCQY